jgi:hypothetical protein
MAFIRARILDPTGDRFFVHAISGAKDKHEDTLNKYR